MIGAKLKVIMTKADTGGRHNEYFTMNHKLIENGIEMSNEQYNLIKNFAQGIAALTTNTYQDTNVELTISVAEKLS